MTPTAQIAAIRQRAEQATPGPWVVDYMELHHRKGSPNCLERCAAGIKPDRVYHQSAEEAARQKYTETEIHVMVQRDVVVDVVAANEEHVVCNGHDYNDGGYVSPQNAEFIAHSREDIPFLLQQIDARESALRALVAQIEARAKECYDISLCVDDFAHSCVQQAKATAHLADAAELERLLESEQ